MARHGLARYGPARPGLEIFGGQQLPSVLSPVLPFPLRMAAVLSLYGFLHFAKIPFPFLP
jgi:hypothetical protein